VIIRTTVAACHGSRTIDFLRPRFFPTNARSPRARYAWHHRLMVPRATWNTAAASVWDIPPSTAATTRFRKASCAEGDNFLASFTVMSEQYHTTPEGVILFLLWLVNRQVLPRSSRVARR